MVFSHSLTFEGSKCCSRITHCHFCIPKYFGFIPEFIKICKILKHQACLSDFFQRACFPETLAILAKSSAIFRRCGALSWSRDPHSLQKKNTEPVHIIISLSWNIRNTILSDLRKNLHWKESKTFSFNDKHGYAETKFNIQSEVRFDIRF